MIEIATLTGVLKAAGAAKEIGKLVGLLETSDIKLDKLLQVELKAGISNLKDAERSNSEKEQKILLRDARGNFQKAAHLEAGAKKATALIGLALCHRWLGDERNCLSALNAILEINPIKRAKIVQRAVDLAWYEFSDVLNYILLGVFLTSFGLAGWSGNPLRETVMVGGVVLLGVIFFINIFRRLLNRKEYYKKLASEGVEIDEDGQITRQIQLAVAAYLGKPVPWIDALG